MQESLLFHTNSSPRKRFLYENDLWNRSNNWLALRCSILKQSCYLITELNQLLAENSSLHSESVTPAGLSTRVPPIAMQRLGIPHSCRLKCESYLCDNNLFNLVVLCIPLDFFTLFIRETERAFALYSRSNIGIQKTGQLWQVPIAQFILLEP